MATDPHLEAPIWFGVRQIFRVLASDEGCFEERITLWRADSIEQAIEMAESEAAEYADPEPGLVEYTGFAQAFATSIPDRAPASGDEVFSLMRDSRSTSEDYITRFFDTGSERTGSLG